MAPEDSSSPRSCTNNINGDAAAADDDDDINCSQETAPLISSAAAIDDQSLNLSLGIGCSNVPNNTPPYNLQTSSIIKIPPPSPHQLFKSPILSPPDNVISPFIPSTPPDRPFSPYPNPPPQNPSLYLVPGMSLEVKESPLNQEPTRNNTTIPTRGSKPRAHHHWGRPSLVRSPRENVSNDEIELIPPPFPWATNKRCHVYELQVILNQTTITSITGDVQCKKCGKAYTMALDLQSKFREVASYILQNMDELRHRAPYKWTNPTLPRCNYCNKENAVKPVNSKNEEFINWLFLFLGEMLGCCNLKELKYFCKHTGNHRTAVKDRLLYLAYLTMCKQLDPTGPF